MSKQIDKKMAKEQFQTATELEEYQKNPNISIVWEKLQVVANSHIFKINPEGHLLDNKTKIRNIQNKYKKDMKIALDESDQLDQNDIYEKTSEEILKIALQDFNYSIWANHIDIGPTVLGQIATEVSTFLVVQGGKAGFKHWQMQQKLAIVIQSNHYNTSKD